MYIERVNQDLITSKVKYRDYFVDVQIEEKEFSIAYDKTEPDEPQGYALVTKENFYATLAASLKDLLIS